jgi:uncharacterized protein (TIGR03790 family)
MHAKMGIWTFAVALSLGPLAERPARAAVEPRDVVLVVNKTLEVSREIADTYVTLRNVPRTNVIELDLPLADDISRDDYNRLMVAPLRAIIQERKLRPKVLLMIYGVPLRVGPQTPSAKDREELAQVKIELDAAQAQNTKLLESIKVLERDKERDPQSPLAEVIPRRQAEQHAIKQKIDILEEKQRQLTQAESGASVDSELMLLWWNNYPLARWMLNPLYWQFADRQRTGLAAPVMMTCRLDGPSPAIAKRLVQDAVQVEKNGGLRGKVYIDARGIPFDRTKDAAGTGYGGYDESFREAAKLLRLGAKMDVTLDDQEALFPARSCPDCALYAGWYALKNYTPCCRFNTGAIAWHLASLEAVSLRHPEHQWAGNILLDGAAATLGPVAEPYTVGFPKPEEFFGFLVTGEYTLVECYARTTLLTSWMMVLVGDPLYNPYAKTPKLKPFDVLPSPLGARLLGQ